MNNTWLTKDTDIALANDVLRKHLDFNDGERLAILNIEPSLNHARQCLLADWVVELSDAYTEKYGEKQGSRITKKVMACLIVANKTIH